MKYWTTSLLLVLTLLLSSCSAAPSSPSATQAPSTSTTTVTLCFISDKRDQDEHLIVEEQRDIPYAGGELESYVLQALFSGPRTEEAAQVIPSNLSVSKLEKKEGTTLVVVTFSGERPKENFDFLLVKTSIAMTLLQLPEVKQVGVYLDEIVYDQNGQPADLYSLDTIVTPDTLNSSTQRRVSIWKPDLKSNTITSRNSTVPGSTTNALLSAIISEVLKSTDTLNRNLYNPDCRVLSLLLEEDSLTLNFSEHIEPDSASAEQTRLCLEALVASLCQNATGITQIEILVTGKTYDGYSPYSQNGVMTIESVQSAGAISKGESGK